MEVANIKRKPTGRQPGLRSLDNRLFNCPVEMTFVNGTKRDVDILWAGYDHDYILYHTLKPLQAYKVTTYVGHPWVFEDALTRDAMVVDGNEVWWPPPVAERVVFITLPVLPLTKIAARKVRDHLRSVEDASELELPAQLCDNITKLARTLHFHKNRQTLHWAEEPAIQDPTDREKDRMVLLALILHDVLGKMEGRDMNLLLSVQLFLQYIQSKGDPYHAAVQALLIIFESCMDSDNVWMEVDQLLVDHVEEMVEKMLKLVDVHSTVNQIRSVSSFIEHILVNIESKYNIEDDAGEV